MYILGADASSYYGLSLYTPVASPRNRGDGPRIATRTGWGPLARHPTQFGHISARSPKRHRDTDLRTDLGNIRAKMGSGFQFGAAGKEARKVSRELEVRAHFARDRST